MIMEQTSSFLISPTTVSDFIVLTIASNTHNCSYVFNFEKTNKNVSEILIKKLKIDSLLSIDSYKVFVSGNGDFCILFHCKYKQEIQQCHHTFS